MLVDPHVIQELRELSLRGASLRDMILMLRQRLGLAEDAEFPVFLYMRSAFLLPVKDAKLITALDLFPGGTWTEEAVAAHVMPRIQSMRDKWGQGLTPGGDAGGSRDRDESE